MKAKKITWKEERGQLNGYIFDMEEPPRLVAVIDDTSKDFPVRTFFKGTVQFFTKHKTLGAAKTRAKKELDKYVKKLQEEILFFKAYDV